MNHSMAQRCADGKFHCHIHYSFTHSFITDIIQFDCAQRSVINFFLFTMCALMVAVSLYLRRTLVDCMENPSRTSRTFADTAVWCERNVNGADSSCQCALTCRCKECFSSFIYDCYYCAWVQLRTMPFARCRIGPHTYSPIRYAAQERNICKLNWIKN